MRVLEGYTLGVMECFTLGVMVMFTMRGCGCGCTMRGRGEDRFILHISFADGVYVCMCVYIYPAAQSGEVLVLVEYHQFWVKPRVGGGDWDVFTGLVRGYSKDEMMEHYDLHLRYLRNEYEFALVGRDCISGGGVILEVI